MARAAGRVAPVAPYAAADGRGALQRDGMRRCIRYDRELAELEAKIDYGRPMFGQVHRLGAGYDKWVHAPVENGRLRLFAWDFFEFFTDTPWYYIPILWLPVVAYFVLAAVNGRDALRLLSPSPTTVSWGMVPPLLVGGLAIWSLLEYLLHRYLFHTVPSSNAVLITAHFLLHGLHHKSPMERGRLVFPPPLTVVLATPIYLGIVLLAPQLAIGRALFAGGLLGYILYDMTHYYTHHGVPRLAYFREMKRYHMAHHYKDCSHGFGITSKLWDVPFGTLLGASARAGA